MAYRSRSEAESPHQYDFGSFQGLPNPGAHPTNPNAPSSGTHQSVPNAPHPRPPPPAPALPPVPQQYTFVESQAGGSSRGPGTNQRRRPTPAPSSATQPSVEVRYTHSEPFYHRPAGNNMSRPGSRSTGAVVGGPSSPHGPGGATGNKESLPPTRTPVKKEPKQEKGSTRGPGTKRTPHGKNNKNSTQSKNTKKRNNHKTNGKKNNCHPGVSGGVPVPPEVAFIDAGTKAKAENKLEQALQCYQQACTIKPDYATGHYNIGTIYSEMGRFDDARKAFEQALQYNPGYAEVYCNLGVLYKTWNNTDQAIHYYQRCLSLDDACEQASCNLAIAFTDLGAQHQTAQSFDQAITMYEQALYYNPRNATAHYNLAVIYSHQGQANQAVSRYSLALTFDPTLPDVHVKLGLLYRDLLRYDQALVMFQRALRPNPQCAQLYNHLGLTFILKGEADQALHHLSRALELQPDSAETHGNLGLLYTAEGQLDKAMSAYDTGASAGFSRHVVHGRLMASTYQRLSAEDMFQAHTQWAHRWEQSHVVHHHDRPDPLSGSGAQHVKKEEGSVLRVGYLVSFLFAPETQAFVHGILAHHGPSVVVYCYTNHLDLALATSTLRDAPIQWRSLYQQTSECVAEGIRADQIDVLVDLNGHTLGNRLDVLLHRPAPIQVAYLGSPNTRGLSCLDYLVCDAITGAKDGQRFTETLLPLERCAFAYSPCESLRLLPSLESGCSVTFGYCGELASLTDEVVSVWARLLRELPSARLVVRAVIFQTAWVRGHVMDKFTAHGVTLGQVELKVLPVVMREVGLQDIDIFLDPWPVGSLLALCDALYLGIPVVSMQGSCYSHNRGKSILTALGMTDWVACDANDYVRIASHWARQPDALKEFRRSLPDLFAKSPVSDCPGLATALEQQYRRVYDLHTNSTQDDAPDAMEYF